MHPKRVSKELWSLQPDTILPVALSMPSVAKTEPSEAPMHFAKKHPSAYDFLSNRTPFSQKQKMSIVSSVKSPSPDMC